MMTHMQHASSGHVDYDFRLLPKFPLYSQIISDQGVRTICGADGCRLECEDRSLQPNVDIITCSNRKLDPSPNKVRRIGCAPNANMFSAKCGSISQDIAFPDLDQMSVFCTTTKVSWKFLLKLTPTESSSLPHPEEFESLEIENFESIWR